MGTSSSNQNFKESKSQENKFSEEELKNLCTLRQVLNALNENKDNRLKVCLCGLGSSGKSRICKILKDPGSGDIKIGDSMKAVTHVPQLIAFGDMLLMDTPGLLDIDPIVEMTTSQCIADFKPDLFVVAINGTTRANQALRSLSDKLKSIVKGSNFRPHSMKLIVTRKKVLSEDDKLILMRLFGVPNDEIFSIDLKDEDEANEEENFNKLSIFLEFRGEKKIEFDQKELERLKRIGQSYSGFWKSVFLHSEIGATTGSIIGINEGPIGILLGNLIGRSLGTVSGVVHGTISVIARNIHVNKTKSDLY